MFALILIISIALTTNVDGDQAIIKVDVDGYTYELNGGEATLISLGTEKKNRQHIQYTGKN